MTSSLLNVILPFFFFELKFVLIAFIFVVILETFIVNHFIQREFGLLFQVLIFANISTTIFGYFLQGVIRLIVTILFDIQSNHAVVEGLTGNIGWDFGNYPKGNLSVFISILTSIIIALFLSIYFETKILKNWYEGKVAEASISKGVKYANIISYSFLFLWIYLNYIGV